MEQTYLCKFDTNGRRTDTLLTCEFNDEEKAKKLAEGYIEISEEDWNYYVGNKGNGKNGTGYIRGKDGKPTDAPAYVPTKEEKLAALDAQYEQDVADLTKYYGEASLKGDTETQAELQAELAEVDATYAEERKAIEEE
jgi:hypothetical protein